MQAVQKNYFLSWPGGESGGSESQKDLGVGSASSSAFRAYKDMASWSTVVPGVLAPTHRYVGEFHVCALDVDGYEVFDQAFEELTHMMVGSSGSECRSFSSVFHRI